MSRKWTHRYAWGNNPVRASVKGKLCRVLARGSRQTVLLEFETGDLMTSSLRALRRIAIIRRKKRRPPH